MHKTLLISICTVLFFTAAHAQEKKEVVVDTIVTNTTYENNTYENASKDTIFVDTALYFNPPHMPADSVTAWKNSTTFAYIKSLDSLLKTKKDKPVKEEESYSPRKTNWLESLFSSSGVKVFLWTLAVLFVLFILYKLFLTDGVFRRNTATATITPEIEEEVITTESDFERLIRQAVQNGNYRLAVRYQYLQALHKLAARNLVELAADKTNYQYVREIANAVHQNEFAALTLNYEYVWYGEFAIEEPVYRKIESGFLQFNNRL